MWSSITINCNQFREAVRPRIAPINPYKKKREENEETCRRCEEAKRQLLCCPYRPSTIRTECGSLFSVTPLFPTVTQRLLSGEFAHAHKQPQRRTPNPPSLLRLLQNSRAHQ